MSRPSDPDFKPNSNELWVMNKGGGAGGSMVIVRNAGFSDRTDSYKKDTHSDHSMMQVSAMAFQRTANGAP